MIPKTSTSILQKGYGILFLVLPFLAIAQEEFPDDTDDLTPAAPIEDYVPLALLLGIYFAYLFLKARITKSN
jgi:hypothetical protein